MHGHTYLTVIMRKSAEVSPTTPGETPGQPILSCYLCPRHKPFAKGSCLKRHFQEKHKRRSKCPRNNCNYTWTKCRNSELIYHLSAKHKLKGNTIDEILAKPPILCDLPPSELEQYASAHSPRGLLEEYFAPLWGYHNIHHGFRFVPAFYMRYI